MIKIEIKLKLNLIYDSKCKINTKWWNIKIKTHNLTQISLWNDTINRRMHGFSFRIFEDEIEVQDVISPLSWDQIPISSTPWMWKCIKNTKKLNWHSNWCLDSLNFSKIQGRLFSSWRTVFKEVILGVSVDLTYASRSTVAMRSPLANRHFCLMTVWSRMKGRDVISLHKEGGV